MFPFIGVELFARSVRGGLGNLVLRQKHIPGACLTRLSNMCLCCVSIENAILLKTFVRWLICCASRARLSICRGRGWLVVVVRSRAKGHTPLRVSNLYGGEVGSVQSDEQSLQPGGG